MTSGNTVGTPAAVDRYRRRQHVGAVVIQCQQYPLVGGIAREEEQYLLWGVRWGWHCRIDDVFLTKRQICCQSCETENQKAEGSKTRHVNLAQRERADMLGKVVCFLGQELHGMQSGG